MQRLKEFMPETLAYCRALLRRGHAAASADGDHGPKLLLALGGAAIAMSALSMAHALAQPVLPVTHDPGALDAAGYFSRLSPGGLRFADAADEAVLTLVKTYGVAP